MSLDQPKKEKQKYVLHCDACSFHRVTDGTEDLNLIEIKTAPIPGTVPSLQDGKIVVPPSNPRQKKFKCPKCGRGVTARYFNVQSLSHIELEEDEDEFDED